MNEANEILGRFLNLEIAEDEVKEYIKKRLKTPDALQHVALKLLLERRYTTDVISFVAYVSDKEHANWADLPGGSSLPRDMADWMDISADELVQKALPFLLNHEEHMPGFLSDNIDRLLVKRSNIEFILRALSDDIKERDRMRSIQEIMFHLNDLRTRELFMIAGGIMTREGVLEVILGYLDGAPDADFERLYTTLATGIREVRLSNRFYMKLAKCIVNKMDWTEAQNFCEEECGINSGGLSKEQIVRLMVERMSFPGLLDEFEKRYKITATVTREDGIENIVVKLGHCDIVIMATRDEYGIGISKLLIDGEPEESNLSELRGIVRDAIDKQSL